MGFAGLFRRTRLAKEIKPTYGGYSIGKWVNEDGDGRYDVLEVETRLQGAPRLLWERASAAGACRERKKNASRS